jgi:DNA-binding NarL/FixJ family response regulator
MKPVSVLVADDHEITRIGIESMFEDEGDYTVCAQATDGRSAVKMTRCLRPDLVVLDVGLPKLNGLDAARQILSDNPEQRILVFTEIESDRTMRAALEAGVRGYVLKSDRVCHLLAAADALLHGRTFFTSRMTEIVLALAQSQRREPRLTDREREIIQLMADGHCTTEIAKVLCLSPTTVDTHRTRIRRKLKISSTAELIVYAVRNEMVGIPELNCPTPRLPKFRHALYRAPERTPASEAILPSGPVVATSPISASGNLASAAQAGARISDSIWPRWGSLGRAATIRFRGLRILRSHSPKRRSTV